jgi:hypothetical protein
MNDADPGRALGEAPVERRQLRHGGFVHAAPALLGVEPDAAHLRLDLAAAVFADAAARAVAQLLGAFIGHAIAVWPSTHWPHMRQSKNSPLPARSSGSSARCAPFRARRASGASSGAQRAHPSGTGARGPRMAHRPQAQAQHGALRCVQATGSPLSSLPRLALRLDGISNISSPSTPRKLTASVLGTRTAVYPPGRGQTALRLMVS